MRIVFLTFVAITCMLFSCSDDNNLDVKLKTYDVVIGGLHTCIENDDADNLLFDNNTGNVPDDVWGIKIKVTNLSHSYIEPIEEEFKFIEGEFDSDDVLVNSVYADTNMFTAEAYENEPLKGWVDVEMMNSEGFDLYNDKDIDLFAEKYAQRLNEMYPVYNIFRDTVEQYIGSDIEKNEVDFHMKAVNGRLAIVIENRKDNEDGGVDYIDVKIDGGDLKRIEKGKAICYLVNDDESEGEVKVEVYPHRVKFPDFVNRRVFFIKKGTNTTRLLTVV